MTSINFPTYQNSQKLGEQGRSIYIIQHLSNLSIKIDTVSGSTALAPPARLGPCLDPIQETGWAVKQLGRLNRWENSGI